MFIPSCYLSVVASSKWFNELAGYSTFGGKKLNECQDAYAALQQNGASLPEQCNIANLAGVIESTGSGEGDGTDWGTLYTTKYPNGLILDGMASFIALCDPNGNSQGLDINGEQIVKNTITGYDFGRLTATVGDAFLQNCNNLTRLGHVEKLVACGNSFCASSGLSQSLHFQNLEYVGHGFMARCGEFNAALSFPKIKIIAPLFLQSASSFSKPLIIPSSVQRIGYGFMFNATHFASTITIYSTVTPDENTTYYALSTSVSPSDPIYAKGVTLRGSGASIWKSALPNRSASPWRKLILG